MNEFCIITTINKPTKAIEEYHQRFGERLIVIGDVKTPFDWKYKDVAYFPPSFGTPYSPKNHYARKNAGYMYAIKNKATLIHDCDDDTYPNENWHMREIDVEAYESLFDKWFNVYDFVGHGTIWPRGFSLKHIKVRPSVGANIKAISPIQQGLINGDPDVDAIWRLALQKEPYYFTEKMSVYLKPKIWCPFNSQSTWWFPIAYPLLYLPVSAPFRMTDIWRSFVAQRCLWELEMGVTFHSPAEVFQDRNEHDLLADFNDEIEGYRHNDKIVDTLEKLSLSKGVESICHNMRICYRALINIGVLPEKEELSLIEWIKDYEKFA